MGWEEDLFALFDDLEQQAAALHDAERGPELADRAREEYRQVTLAGRLTASAGAEVTLDVVGVGPVNGLLDRVTATWCLVSGDSPAAPDWVVPLTAVTRVVGASDRAVPEVAWSPLARLSLASALRRLADSGERCVLRLRDGARHEGVLRRVGADFVELAEPSGRLAVVATAHLAAVQSHWV